ncbi:MAG: TetR/AcrR family transcriptional regulator [Deltaproteobacteria bacterium]|nr:TetR/AcrR family transcriptional regulator [Deltaproteobacteria bacterium]
MDQGKREGILASAAKLFANCGFRKASIDEIARGAGVAKGTVYLACESKEDLYYQTLLREARAWVADTLRIIDPREPADELLLRVSAYGFERIDNSPLWRDLLTGKVHELLPNWAERFGELRKLGCQPVMEILRIGISQGRFRADLDVEALAPVLQDMQLSGYLYLANKPNPDDVLRRQAAGLELVLRGILAGPVTRPLLKSL